MTDDQPQPTGKVTGIKVSRMDPMETYDAGAIALQIMDHQKKAAALEADAASFVQAAKVERTQVEELEKILARVRKRDADRRAAGGS